MKHFFCAAMLNISILLATATTVSAQITERPRPAGWEKLVKGASFKDRILPMPKGVLSSQVWGGANVLPRYIDNGIEDAERSYWGGNILTAPDGSYHLFVCGWPESSPKGHAQWPQSIVYHTSSKNRFGPYTIQDTIGSGHNPELFQLKDGRLVLYCIDKNYVANSLNGPWTEGKFDFDARDRPIIEGLSNLSFAQRPDGSYLMVCRGGGIWISQTGLSVYRQISNERAYPNVAGEFEDPVIWKDQVQYNMIVNDWLGRIAYYLRSKDGVNWITDPGEAYAPGVAVHEDGTVEDWFKFERIKILQDNYGRAIQANFAVIDTLKNHDKPNDRHSSKNISIPLNPGLLITMLNKTFPGAKETIQIKIAAEPGFDPQQDLDIASLRFGSSENVNFGNGARVVSTQKQGKDLILVFSAANHGLSVEEFAPKLIGKYKSGKIVFGYTRVPWVKYDAAILSALRPVFKAGTDRTHMQVVVENFGLDKSVKSRLTVYIKTAAGKKEIASGQIPPIAAYGKYILDLEARHPLEKGSKYDFIIEISDPTAALSSFEFSATPFD